MSKKQNPTLLKLHMGGGPIGCNHNESALRVRKGLPLNHNEPTLKMRQGIDMNESEMDLKMRKNLEGETELKVHIAPGQGMQHNDTALKVRMLVAQAALRTTTRPR